MKNKTHFLSTNVHYTFTVLVEYYLKMSSINYVEMSTVSSKYSTNQSSWLSLVIFQFYNIY